MKWFLLELLTYLNMSSIVHKLKLLTVQGGRTRLFFFCCLAKYRCSLPSLQRIKNKKWFFFFSSRTLFAKRNMKFNFICTNLMFGWILKTFWTLMQYMQTARSRFPLVSIREITLRRLKQKTNQLHEYYSRCLNTLSVTNILFGHYLMHLFRKMIIYVIYTFCKINNTKFVPFCIRTNIFNHLIIVFKCRFVSLCRSFL